MATEKEILDEQAFATNRISTQVRTVGLSIIAVSWVFLSGSVDVSAIPANKPGPTMLYWCIVLSFLSLVFDYFQYWAAYKSSLATHDKGPDKDGEYRFNLTSAHYRMRRWFFHLKQWVLWAAILVFLLAILGALK